MNEFLALIISAYDKEIIKKVVFSRPCGSEVSKISARVCRTKRGNVLSLEYSLPGNTVSHKNLIREEIPKVLEELLNSYRQINLITTLGDAERKLSISGKETLLGTKSLARKISDGTPNFVKAVEELDKRKNYILSGEEEFLKILGISDSRGRVHDKKQGKFRQINKFLEHINAIYEALPENKDLLIYDLCSGKSYLSFAVYYHLTYNKKRRVKMLSIDLKRDVIEWCARVSESLGFDGMKFLVDNVKNTPSDISPDMVISLHACDVATDIVINRAIELGASVILSTPCCHSYLNDKINQKALEFVTETPQLRNKLCEALTDAIRLARLRAYGYKALAVELTDPENTPKNTLLRAVKDLSLNDGALRKQKEEYDEILEFVLGDKKSDYLKEIL